jgi:four helix bundle protein
MGRIESYRDLDAWNAAMDLVLAVYRLAEQMPDSERYDLCRQMRRAAVSIPSNVAEGQANGPGGRYRHHVRMAQGSLAELETQLELSVRLKFLKPREGILVKEQTVRTGRLLQGLRRSLQRRGDEDT